MTHALDPDYGHKVCRNCGRGIMFIRRSHRAKAHWQHVGDGLRQYQTWPSQLAKRST